MLENVTTKLDGIRDQCSKFSGPYENPQYRGIINNLVKLQGELDLLKTEDPECVTRKREVLRDIMQVIRDVSNKLHPEDKCEDCT